MMAPENIKRVSSVLGAVFWCVVGALACYVWLVLQ